MSPEAKFFMGRFQLANGLVDGSPASAACASLLLLATWMACMRRPKQNKNTSTILAHVYPNPRDGGPLKEPVPPSRSAARTS